MSDLEDFLRRAAQKRQAKAAEQKQTMNPPRRVAPQYSDRRTERIPAAEPDEVVVAEVVDEPTTERRRRRQSASSGQARATSPPTTTQAPHVHAMPSETHQAPEAPASVIHESSSVAQELIALMRKPGGIRQAVLLKEVIDRPEHRW